MQSFIEIIFLMAKADTWKKRKTKKNHKPTKRKRDECGSQMVPWLGRQDSAFATCST